jgi:hypothetical protein
MRSNLIASIALLESIEQRIEAKIENERRQGTFLFDTLSDRNVAAGFISNPELGCGELEGVFDGVAQLFWEVHLFHHLDDVLMRNRTERISKINCYQIEIASRSIGIGNDLGDSCGLLQTEIDSSNEIFLRVAEDMLLKFIVCFFY